MPHTMLLTLRHRLPHRLPHTLPHTLPRILPRPLLQLLLEEHWTRMGLSIPIYFSSGMSRNANLFYKHYSGWTNRPLHDDSAHALFDFTHVCPFARRELLGAPGPCVLFATPGMIHAGVARDAFKQWAGDSKNLLLLPAACSPDTLAAQILAGAKKLTLDGEVVHVWMRATTVAFSAHADARGLVSLVRAVEPRGVCLVHGIVERMRNFRSQLRRLFGIPVYVPGNGEMVSVEAEGAFNVHLTQALLRAAVKAVRAAAIAVAGKEAGEEAREEAGEEAVEAEAQLGIDRANTEGDAKGDRTKLRRLRGPSDFHAHAAGDKEGVATAVKEKEATAVERPPSDACTDAAVALSLGVAKESEEQRWGLSGVLLLRPAVAGHAAPPRLQFATTEEAASASGLPTHQMRAVLTVPFPGGAAEPLSDAMRALFASLCEQPRLASELHAARESFEASFQMRVRSMTLTAASEAELRLEWLSEDEALAGMLADTLAQLA